MAADTRVMSEPLTYGVGAPNSYFRDLLLSSADGSEAHAARARQERHITEMRVELPRREMRAREAQSDVRFERRRDVLNTASPSTPPLWLIDEFATAPRPGRVLSALVGSDLLPAGVASVRIPRITGGTDVAPAPDGVAVTSKDITDAETLSPATPLSGTADVAIQMIEQSPAEVADRVIFGDLAAAYDASLERLMMTGRGTRYEFRGVLDLAAADGVNVITYTDATPTGSRLFPYLGRAGAAVGNNRRLPPQAWLMRTGRWTWLGTSEDSAGMPLSFPSQQAVAPLRSLFGDAAPTPVTSILGWPTYCNDSIPATLGLGNNQDTVLAVRPTDMALFETLPVAVVDLQSLSGTLEARLTLRGYAAFIAGRQPAGISTIDGTGMVVPAGF